MKLYGNLAKFYDWLYSYRDYGKEADFLVRNLSSIESPRLLDVACGTGAHLEVVRKRLPNAELTGIDLNQEYVKIAEKRLKELDDTRKTDLFFRERRKQEKFQLEFQVV